MRPTLTLLVLAACGGTDPGPGALDGDDTDNGPTAAGDCGPYPDGAVEPMALGAVLSPYRWATALHRGDGRASVLDLAGVPCADGDIDWSPFDVLLFVSIPAW